MPGEEQPDDDDGMFLRMAAEGQAAFSLAAATNNIEVVSDRERQLVDTAIVAGVVGALEVMRVKLEAEEAQE